MYQKIQVTEFQVLKLYNAASSRNDNTLAIICRAAMGNASAQKKMVKELCIFHGDHLDGAGSARRGWARQRPAGGVEFLGRTLRDVARSHCERVLASQEVAS